MNREERRLAVNFGLLIYGLGYNVTDIVGPIMVDGERGLWAAFEIDEAPNDLNHFEAELNATLVDHGFYITNIVQDERVAPVYMFCQVIFLHRNR